jgi:hypothetical protein
MATAIEPILAHDHEPESSERSFGLIFAAVLSIYGSWPLLRLVGPRWWALALAAAFAVVALVQPQILRRFNRAWLLLGRLLNRIVSPLVMGAVFFVIVTPIALTARLRRMDVLSLRRQPELASYWIQRPPARPVAESMKRQF